LSLNWRLTACNLLVAAFLDKQIASHTHDQHVYSIQRSFQGLPSGLFFLSPGRRLLKQGRLVVVGRRKEETREFFLFNDLLVLAAVYETPLAVTARPEYVFSSQYQLVDITAIGAEGNYFEIRSAKESFAVAAGRQVSASPWTLLMFVAGRLARP
jgi:hypothetical protein